MEGFLATLGLREHAAGLRSMLGPEASWETPDGDPVSLPAVPHDHDDASRSRRELDFLACGNFTYISKRLSMMMGAAGAARLEEALEDLVNSRTRLCIFLLVLTVLPVGAAHVKRAAKSRGQGRRIRDSASH